METAVKWMYSVDAALVMPYQDNLTSLMNSDEFRNIVDADLLPRMDYIRKTGNVAAHTGKKITKEQAKNFPHKNVIMRALGMKDNVLVDIQKRQARAGEIYLLCSDGLSDMVPDPEMEKILSEDIPLNEKTKRLVDMANANGGKDNITVILVQVEP